MWDLLWKNVVFDVPTDPLDQENLGCAQGECKTDKRIVEENRKLFES